MHCMFDIWQFRIIEEIERFECDTEQAYQRCQQKCIKNREIIYKNIKKNELKTVIC